jgi:hypothetical protein
MLHDRYVSCSLCRKTFVFSVEEQILILRAIPLDDLLDAPGEERSRYILPPSECVECQLKLAERF